MFNWDAAGLPDWELGKTRTRDDLEIKADVFNGPFEFSEFTSDESIYWDCNITLKKLQMSEVKQFIETSGAWRGFPFIKRIETEDGPRDYIVRMITGMPQPIHVQNQVFRLSFTVVTRSYDIYIRETPPGLGGYNPDEGNILDPGSSRPDINSIKFWDAGFDLSFSAQEQGWLTQYTCICARNSVAGINTDMMIGTQDGEIIYGRSATGFYRRAGQKYLNSGAPAGSYPVAIMSFGNAGWVVVFNTGHAAYGKEFGLWIGLPRMLNSGAADGAAFLDCDSSSYVTGSINRYNAIISFAGGYTAVAKEWPPVFTPLPRSPGAPLGTDVVKVAASRAEILLSLANGAYQSGNVNDLALTTEVIAGDATAVFSRAATGANNAFSFFIVDNNDRVFRCDSIGGGWQQLARYVGRGGAVDASAFNDNTCVIAFTDGTCVTVVNEGLGQNSSNEGQALLTSEAFFASDKAIKLTESSGYTAAHHTNLISIGDRGTKINVLQTSWKQDAIIDQLNTVGPFVFLKGATKNAIVCTASEYFSISSSANRDTSRAIATRHQTWLPAGPAFSATMVNIFNFFSGTPFLASNGRDIIGFFGSNGDFSGAGPRLIVKRESDSKFRVCTMTSTVTVARASSATLTGFDVGGDYFFVTYNIGSTPHTFRGKISDITETTNPNFLTVAVTAIPTPVLASSVKISESGQRWLLTRTITPFTIRVGDDNSYVNKTPSVPGLIDSNFIDSYIDDAGVAILCSSSSIYLSSNFGDTFQQIANPLTLAGEGGAIRSMIAARKNGKLTIFLAHATKNKIAYTEDFGATWRFAVLTGNALPDTSSIVRMTFSPFYKTDGEVIAVAANGKCYTLKKN